MLILVGIIALLCGGTAGYILTEKVLISILFGVFIVPFVIRSYCKNHRKKILRQLEESYFEMMQLVLSMTLAGNSPEECFLEVYEEYRTGSLGNIGIIAGDIDAINRRVKMNYSFYDELYGFSLKTRSKDIISSCEAMKISGEKGGNISQIIKNHISNMRIKLETEKEITQTLSGPKYNQKIITTMPFVLVLMIKGMSREYISVLYNTKIGTLIVAGVSVVILIAWFFGERLSDIDI